MTSRSLIGTELDQVPVNGMLGGLAYQSSENATIETLNLKNLADIDQDTDNTAVDVFVYDTSKDSDGGAWRYRTKNTSWYNETLNTATRGSRREFPAVAVIVVELFKLTIYDGDDPDLPMWMVFYADTSAWETNATFLSLAYAPGTGMNLTRAKCLNAKLIVTGSEHGIVTIDFINETQNNRRPDLSGFVVVHKKSGSIVSRNDTSGQDKISSTEVTINRFCNDLAVTVLPNAPIDPSTGLQIPTIAVGTNGGVSVIREDGTVISTASASARIRKIDFTDDYGLNAIISNSSGANWGNVYVNDIETIGGLAYGTYANWDGVLYEYKYNPKALTYKTASVNDTISNFIDIENRSSAIGVPAIGGGLTLFEKSPKASFYPDAGMVAFITSSYSTGYQHGDIKGTFLSDTDTTDAVGTELVTGWVNGGTYAYDTLSTSGSTITSAISDGSDWAGAVTNAMSFISGKKYVASFSLTINSGSVLSFVFFGTNQSGGGSLSLGNHLINIGSGSHSITFTAPSTGTYYLIMQSNNGSAENFTTGPVSVRLAEEDRSVNNNGLQVFGTITKTPVATGAELVGYSGFSSSDYLIQPNNSDLAPGKGVYSVTCWIKTASSGSNDQYIFDRGVGGQNSRNLMLVMQNSGRIQFYHTRADGTSSDLQTTDMPSVADNNWHQVVGLYDGLAYRVYIDGKASSVTNTTGRDVGNDGTPALTIGTRFNITQTFGGDLALFRYSLSIPSPEQIKKIYDNEKFLFQENAKATLYGSSDAVTALAHDDSTNLLHVGTSSGRSDFSGLTRVDHSTLAVTTAISAHDGLIAQQ